MLDIYIDADACPVKDEVLRVAERHGLTVHMVGNTWHRVARHPLVKAVVVPQGPDAADDWIADSIGAGDIAITADVPLASRCVARKARVLAPNGREFSEASIGMDLAVRNLMTGLRESGEITGGPSSFGRQDRSRFLQALETVIQAVRKDQGRLQQAGP